MRPVRDYGVGVPDNEALDVVRGELTEAIGRYADLWSETEGGMVKSFVVLAEVFAPDQDAPHFFRMYGPPGVTMTQVQYHGLLSYGLATAKDDFELKEDD